MRILSTILIMLGAFFIAAIFVAAQKFCESLIGVKATFVLGMLAFGVFIYKYIVPEIKNTGKQNE